MSRSAAKLRVALVSNSENARSETFIQAHRRLLDADVRFYYRGWLPSCLDGVGQLRSQRSTLALVHRLRGKMFGPDFGFDQLDVRASLARERIDVVLAEFGPAGAAMLPICKSLGLPLIVHFHGFDASVHSVLERYADAYREMFAHATFVIVVSRVMERRLLDLGCPPQKLVYNPCGPSDAFFQVQRQPVTPAHFVGVGRFVDKKAPHLTLLAFRHVLGRFPSARLSLVGDGPLQPICRDLVRFLGMGDQVSIPGAVRPDAVLRLFAGATAFVQHSVTATDGDMEGTPVAVLEAGAAALPVVATRHGGIRDVVVDGETGLLVDEHDVAGMAAMMTRLLESPAYANALGESARRRVATHFSMTEHIGRLNECVARAAR